VRAEPGSVLFEAGDPHWHEQVRPSVSPAPPMARPAAGPLRLASPPAHGRRIWREERPSEAARHGAASLAQRLRRVGEAARRRGLALHACFAQVGWLEEERPDPAQLRRAVEQATRRTGDGSGPDEFVLEFLALLQRPNLDAMLRRASYERRWPGLELTVWRERDFVMRQGETLVRGRYDRVVLGTAGGRVRRAHVVEFKTDRLLSRDPSRVAEAAEAYRSQINAYRAAVAERVGLPACSVEASLAFVVDDLLYDWPVSMQERQ
jgi:ATP-dependent exoDNAse (exonuclease V) beta subunit